MDCISVERSLRILPSSASLWLCVCVWAFLDSEGRTGLGWGHCSGLVGPRPRL